MEVLNEIKKLNSTVELSPLIVFFILYCLFFCSGFSALIYQVMWQRMLFTAFGVDLVSITIIVSVFMFGLGMGGLIGGIIADKFTSRLLTWYIAIEVGIAVFGFFSPYIIEGIGNAFFSNSEIMTAISSFFILAFPTILMGATFPILVTHVNKIYQNVGRSVGDLYFINTLGGALGAYFSGFVLLYVMDLVGAVHWAAFINLMIAFVALLIFRRQ